VGALVIRTLEEIERATALSEPQMDLRDLVLWNVASPSTILELAQ
jgi:hypothetical protein